MSCDPDDTEPDTPAPGHRNVPGPEYPATFSGEIASHLSAWLFGAVVGFGVALMVFKCALGGYCQ